MKKRKKQPDITRLPTKQLPPKFEMELPPDGFETCIACKAMKNLRIKRFNSIPGNCRAQHQKDFWCTQLYIYNLLK
jgi:hypothetical protein